MPPIFTKVWNQQRDHEFTDTINDDKLNEQVTEANNTIRIYNTILMFNAPRFACDFTITRRKKKLTRRAIVNKTRYNFCPALMKDGVHPEPIIARKWLHKIINIVLDEPIEVSDTEPGPSNPKRQKQRDADSDSDLDLN